MGYEWLLVVQLIHFGDWRETQTPVLTEELCYASLAIVLEHPKTIKAKCVFIGKSA
jgi:hypothetical protein